MATMLMDLDIPVMEGEDTEEVEKEIILPEDEDGIADGIVLPVEEEEAM